jgi:hypothetical protein
MSKSTPIVEATSAGVSTTTRWQHWGLSAVFLATGLVSACDAGKLATTDEEWPDFEPYAAGATCKINPEVVGVGEGYVALFSGLPSDWNLFLLVEDPTGLTFRAVQSDGGVVEFAATAPSITGDGVATLYRFGSRRVGRVTSCSFEIVAEPVCGDGVCNGIEDCDSCPTDCQEGCEPPVEPTPDAGVEPTPDAGVEPTPDAGVQPTPDAGVEPPPAGDARAIFDAQIQPMLQARCALCHGPNSVGPQLWTEPSYEQVTGNTLLVGNFDPAAATLLTKGPHAGANWWSPTEEQTISDWLLAEAEERNSGTTPTGPSAMSTFIGCMNYQDFVDSSADRLAHLGTDERFDDCADCHGSGQHNVALCDRKEELFAQWKTYYGFHTVFRVEVNNAGEETVVLNFDKYERVGNGTTLHPMFNYESGRFDYVRDFYERTMQRMASGDCGPPVDPVPLMIPACVQ